VFPRVRAAERKGEQTEAAGRDGHAGPLRPRQPLWDEKREDADAAGRRRLDERQRCERERGDVQHPAAEPGDEPDDPAALGEQRAQREDRAPE